MGGQVIIIAQDPDARSPDLPGAPAELQAKLERGRKREPRVQVTNTTLQFAEDATPTEISEAVHKVLKLGQALKEQ